MTAAGRKHRKLHKPAHGTPAPRSNDKAVYGAFVIVGVFIAFLLWLMFPNMWKPITLGYIAAIAFLINSYAISAYQGKHLAGWKQALARIPLRPVGFGRKGAKPLEAAHNAPQAKSAIVLSVVITLLVIAGLTFLLLPETRFWN